MRRIMKTFAVIIVLTTVAAAAWAAEPIATLRGLAPLVEQDAAPAMSKVANKDLRRLRSFPEQPPTIPHRIRGYQINLNASKCMSCHSRQATTKSKAPMVSITHFTNREGEVLATVSPRRYFCTQCHVTQQDIEPLIGNDFVDIDAVLAGQD
jgi:cytochrome c-type protein NapB